MARKISLLSVFYKANNVRIKVRHKCAALTVKNEDKTLKFFLGDFDIISHLETHYEVNPGKFSK